MTMISSAMPLREARARARFASSLRVMRQAEMRFIARRRELAAERSISWSPRSHPECGSSKEGRIGDLLTDKFSDQFSFDGAIEVARGKEGGEFSVAIEEEALSCFDDFR